MTVSLPAARRLAATKCSTAKASSLALWSFSSSETSPRQKSDERTSVGLKWVRAKVDLPQPEGPIRTTNASSGIFIFMYRTSTLSGSTAHSEDGATGGLKLLRVREHRAYIFTYSTESEQKTWHQLIT